jgi:hypothetical protein
VECYRHHRCCSLAPNEKEIDKQFAIKEKLDEEIMETEAKTIRLRKQRRLAIKRLRELGDREALNIAELEADERRAEALEEEIDAILSSPNPSSLEASASSGVDPSLVAPLAQERLDLSGENSQPAVGSS